MSSVVSRRSPSSTSNDTPSSSVHRLTASNSDIRLVVLSPEVEASLARETSDTGFHGVRPVSEEAPFPRQSFAVYYYTVEASPAWAGVHDSIFRARPDEKVKGYVLMPAEAMGRKLRYGARRIKGGIKRLLGVPRGRGVLQKY